MAKCMTPGRQPAASPDDILRSPLGSATNIFGVQPLDPAPRPPPLPLGSPGVRREISPECSVEELGGLSSSPTARCRSRLILDLAACDYAGGPVWHNRVPQQPHASVPASVRFDGLEKAFVFQAGGDVISVPLATNPQVLGEVSYSLWVKLFEPIPDSNLGWCASQSPDYGWSRALTLNDYRLGYVSVTATCYWKSNLGRAPVGRWFHVAGVWQAGGDCTAYVDGVRSASVPARNARGSNPDEMFVIGGRSPHDACHNAALAISDVRVYAAALNAAEIQRLFHRGRAGEATPPAVDGGGDATAAVARTRSEVMSTFALASPAGAEQTALFWCATGVNAYDLPDGEDWQQEFRLALESECGRAEPQPSRRTLQVHLSDAPAPGPARSRQLARHSSDPEKSVRRAAHTKALRRMERRSGVTVMVQGRLLALFRFGGRVFATDAQCPHQGANLVEGEVGDIEDMVEGKRCYVTCPVHKFQFDLASGAVLQGKCEALVTYAVRVRADAECGRAMVEVGFSSLTDDFFFDLEGEDDVF